MGVGVSGWRLARAVSSLGQLGVVSGTMLDVVTARQLQLGDPEGELRRALAAFPYPEIAERFLRRYFISGGKASDAPFKPLPMMAHPPTARSHEASALATFAAVWLAKEGHRGKVGMNLLEKSQLPTLPLLYGAMLAGVDVILMGAGIPKQIPGLLDRLSAGEPAALRLDVTGAQEPFVAEFDPSSFGAPPETLRRPAFVAVVSSHVLADHLRRKSSGRIDGFVVELPSAGGHNAPPRGGSRTGAEAEPAYGPRDMPDLGKFRAMGLPFWLAGGYFGTGALRAAQAEGAAGVQVGSAFALCDESGFEPQLKHQAREAIGRSELDVVTDFQASPTGFPFKIAQLEGTLADPKIYAGRRRVCDIGVLREPYAKPDGSIGFRCPAEPLEAYLAKGGDAAKARDAMCLCNSLGAAIGLGQERSAGSEPALLTLGSELDGVRTLLAAHGGRYAARDVLRMLLA